MTFREHLLSHFGSSLKIYGVGAWLSVMCIFATPISGLGDSSIWPLAVMFAFGWLILGLPFFLALDLLITLVSRYRLS